MKKTALLSILGAYLSSRLLCTLFVYLGHARRPFLQDVPGGWVGLSDWWLNPWTTYDSYWYLDIATSGYQAHSTAFFPLYPYLLKCLGNTPVGMAWAGVILSHACLLLALFFVYQLTIAEHNERSAHWTVWLLCFFPAAPFFGAVYTEALFLLLLAATFYAARRERWWLCAALAFATALVRNPGVLLAIALFLDMRKHQTGVHRHIVPLAPLFAFCLVQLGFWWKYGNPFAGITSQDFFQRQPTWPWLPVVDDLQALVSPGHEFNYYLITATALLVTVIGLLTVACKRTTLRPAYVILVAGITLMNLVYARTIEPKTISGIRYMGALYPFSQLVALFICRLEKHRMAAPLMLGIQLFLFMLFSYYFGWKVLF